MPPMDSRSLQRASMQRWKCHCFLSILDFPILSLIHTKQMPDSCQHNSHFIGVFWTRLSRPHPLVHKEKFTGKSSTKKFPTPVFILTNFGLLFTQCPIYHSIHTNKYRIPVNCAHFIVPPPPPKVYLKST